MKSFVYQGKTAAGKTVRGELEAASEIEARVKLRAQRVIPIKVAEKGSLAAGKKASAGDDIFAFLGLEPKVKSKDLQIFTRQFATLINSGIPIVQAIEILQKQTPSPALKACLTSVRSKVEQGRRLGESVEGWPKVFDRLYVNLVKAGEEGGVLDTILSRLAAYIEKSNKLKGKVVGALWYPAGILVVAAIVITALLVYVIPKFEQLFKQSGQDLPAFTRFVIECSHLLQHYFLLVVMAVIGAIYALKRYYATENGRAAIDSILIQVPVFGSLIQKSSVARFSRTMGTMLSCGIGIVEALDICAGTVGNWVVEKALIRAKIAISEGKSIVQPLGQEPYIPQMVVQMIGVGEATGNMDTMLGKIADFYEEEVDAAVDALTSLMEPIMMVILGAIIAVIVIAMYLPIFNLAGSVAK